jgi:hypothetical protein
MNAKLKALKLTPQGAAAAAGCFASCLFTGKPGVEEILIGRAY